MIIGSSTAHIKYKYDFYSIPILVIEDGVNVKVSIDLEPQMWLNRQGEVIKNLNWDLTVEETNKLIKLLQSAVTQLNSAQGEKK